ncbi:MAG: hypothetical protein ACLQMS_10510 [Desulfomonilaceae bacterium]
MIKPRFWENGRFLLGIVYMLSGLVILVIAFSNLKLLFIQFAPYLPFSVPNDSFERVLHSLPSVFSTSISLVSSVAGFLFGIQWFFYGLADCLRRTPSLQYLGELTDRNTILSLFLSPEKSSSSRFSFGKDSSMRNILARWFTPGTRQVIWATIRSNIKLLFVIALFVLISRLLTVGAVLLNRNFHLQISFAQPDFTNLWGILGALITINLLVALSFVSIRKRNRDLESRDLIVSGYGAMVFFLAIFEELCTLVNSRNLSGNDPYRFQAKLKDGSFAVAGLFESYPNRNNRPANRVVYFLLPLIPCCLIWGFYRLINFQFPTGVIDQHLFFSRYFSSVLLEVVFACFLLFAASHFTRLTRLIFQISKFESYLIACQCSRLLEQSDTSLDSSHPCEWRDLSGPENDLIEWIQQPEEQRRLSVKITWAKAGTESAYASGDRNVTSFENDRELQVLIDRILAVLNRVNFEIQKTSNKSLPVTKN